MQVLDGGMCAPIRVPMLSMATMRPSRTWLNEYPPCPSDSPKRCRKSSMMRMSEIWPVSYPLSVSPEAS